MTLLIVSCRKSIGVLPPIKSTVVETLMFRKEGDNEVVLLSLADGIDVRDLKTGTKKIILDQAEAFTSHIDRVVDVLRDGIVDKGHSKLTRVGITNDISLDFTFSPTGMIINGSAFNKTYPLAGVYCREISAGE